MLDGRSGVMEEDGGRRSWMPGLAVRTRRARQSAGAGQSRAEWRAAINQAQPARWSTTRHSHRYLHITTGRVHHPREARMRQAPHLLLCLPRYPGRNSGT